MATTHNTERMVVGEADLRRAADQPAPEPTAARPPRPPKKRPDPTPEPEPAVAKTPAESKEDAS